MRRLSSLIQLLSVGVVRMGVNQYEAISFVPIMNFVHSWHVKIVLKKDVYHTHLECCQLS